MARCPSCGQHITKWYHSCSTVYQGEWPPTVCSKCKKPWGPGYKCRDCGYSWTEKGTKKKSKG